MDGNIFHKGVGHRYSTKKAFIILHFLYLNHITLCLLTVKVIQL